MRIAGVVYLVCMVCVVACSGSNENVAEEEKATAPQVKESVGLRAREKAPVPARRPVKKERTEPAPRLSAFEREDIEEEQAREQHEKRVAALSERLEEIVDEYYDRDDFEELDYDTLLELFLEDLPEEMRDDVPEEILEEIEFWAD